MKNIILFTKYFMIIARLNNALQCVDMPVMNTLLNECFRLMRVIFKSEKNCFNVVIVRRKSENK